MPLVRLVEEVPGGQPLQLRRSHRDAQYASVSVQALLGRHLSKIPVENTPGQEFDVIRSLCPPKAFLAAFHVNSEIIIPNFQPVRLSGFRSRKENFWVGGCLGAGDCLFQ
jgi:hypothetical protein